jgi:hypothetical protein
MLAPEQNALPLGLRPWPVARIAPIAIFVLALQGCALITFGPVVRVGHLSDNPIDQAILTYQEPIYAKEARMRLLKLLPPGTPTSKAQQYLESIGAKCRKLPAPKGPTTCHYSQYVISGLRSGLIVEYGQWRQYDFAIRLLPGHGPLSNVGVCETTRIFDLAGSEKKGTEDKDGLHTNCTQ